MERGTTQDERCIYSSIPIQLIVGIKFEMEDWIGLDSDPYIPEYTGESTEKV